MGYSTTLALSLAVPAVALPYLPLPLVWIFLVWAAALVFLARRGVGVMRRCAFAAAGVFVVLAIAELAMYELPGEPLLCEHDDAARPTAESSFDGVLGYGPERGVCVVGRDLTGGRPEYDCRCTMDSHGLRVTPASAADEAVLFFGGSYTFGCGVEDDETTAWHVGEALIDRARVYNLGFTGYGPHQTLAGLHAGRVEEVVEVTPRIAVFQLILSHVSRVAGRAGWDVHGPRYTLDAEGRAVRAGRFCDEPLPVPWYVSLARCSSVYRKIRSRTSPQSEVVLMVAVLDEIRRELESRFPGCELHVVFWDESREKTVRILRELERGGFRVHRMSEQIEGYAEDRTVAYLSEVDYHPHVEAHALLARYVVESICAGLGSNGEGLGADESGLGSDGPG